LLLSKNLLTHFLNPAYGVTEPKDAPYAVTGENARQGRKAFAEYYSV